MMRIRDASSHATHISLGIWFVLFCLFFVLFSSPPPVSVLLFSIIFLLSLSQPCDDGGSSPSPVAPKPQVRPGSPRPVRRS